MSAFVPALATALRRAHRPATAPRARPFRSVFVGALLSAAALPLAALADAAAAPAMSLAELPALRDIDGNELAPDVFRGKVVFAMNVASACGYTNAGYALFQRLTDRYAADDFVAVAIPCNSFGWQESGSPDEIKTFALARADRLVITERSDVNGNNQHPIVQLAKSKFPGRISWNFDGRYVFDRSGVPVARFGNSATPDEIEAAIDKVL